MIRLPARAGAPRPLSARRIFLGLLLLPALSSCRSASKLPPLSEGFAARILWSYSRPGESLLFSSKAHVKGREFLRIDASLPFYGEAAGMALSRGLMTVRIPSKGKYYRGEFNVSAFFPDLSPFPPEWLFALLRAEPLSGWPCGESRTGSEKSIRCKAGEFHFKWVFKSGHLRLIEIRDSQKRRLAGRVRAISARPLSEEFFILPGPAPPALKK